MKIASDVLRRFIALPDDPIELRNLLDDVGVEVKHVDRGAAHVSFVVELLANRGDHHCYEGIAREISGRTGASLAMPERTWLDLVATDVPVTIESPLCLQYSATLLERRGVGDMPRDARRVLEAAGLQSVNTPVDATNIANLELGQPTHAFDAERIDGEVVIREARAGEQAWLLFTDAPRPIPAGTLVIADRSKILAIAGVIGCEESKATSATTRILLESGTFDPVAVRVARRALGITTDASARFERGADPARVLVGAGRVVHLLERCGWVRAGGTSLHGDWVDPARVLRLDVEATAHFLGLPLTHDQMTERLVRYGFACELSDDEPGCVDVRVPTWRLWDVNHTADLQEEIARSIGFNATPIALPPAELGSLPSPEERRRARAEEVLLGAGFYEVFTDGFYGRAMRERLGIDEGHPLWGHVETTNALDRAYGLLKNNAIGQAIELVGSAQRMRFSNVKAYEWTRTFHPAPATANDRSASPCVERPLLWLITSGDERPADWSSTRRPADVTFLKGLIQEWANELGLDLALGATDDAHPLASLLHPGRQAALLLNGETVGIVGEVHPKVVASFKIKGARPCYLEVDARALLAEGSRPAFVEPVNAQPIIRNLAFTLPHRVEADALAAYMHATGPDWLVHVGVTDLFVHPGATPALRTVTYALTFACEDHAGNAIERSTDDVNRECERLIEAVHEQFGDAGVRLR